MKKFEYYCCWLDIYNATNIQEFLDEKGLQGWRPVKLVPEKEPDSFKTFFIFEREIL